MPHAICRPSATLCAGRPRAARRARLSASGCRGGRCPRGARVRRRGAVQQPHEHVHARSGARGGLRRARPNAFTYPRIAALERWDVCSRAGIRFGSAGFWFGAGFHRLICHRTLRRHRQLWLQLQHSDVRSRSQIALARRTRIESRGTRLRVARFYAPCRTRRLGRAVRLSLGPLRVRICHRVVLRHCR